jgi:hypothetical protein
MSIFPYSATRANGKAMPADTTRHVASSDTIELATTEAAKRETWADWRPGDPIDPEQLLTRQELVDRARTEGIVVSAQDIANWQGDGVLPRGIRRRRGRVTETLYPHWYVDLLRDLRAQQEEGLRLADIGPRLRPQYVVRPPTATATAKAHIPLVVSVTAKASVRRGDPALTANDDLAQTLRTIARAHEDAYGGHIARVELRLIDDHGNPLTLAIDTD